MAKGVEPRGCSVVETIGHCRSPFVTLEKAYVERHGPFLVSQSRVLCRILRGARCTRDDPEARRLCRWLQIHQRYLSSALCLLRVVAVDSSLLTSLLDVTELTVEAERHFCGPVGTSSLIRRKKVAATIVHSLFVGEDPTTAFLAPKLVWLAKLRDLPLNRKSLPQAVDRELVGIYKADGVVFGAATVAAGVPPRPTDDQSRVYNMCILVAERSASEPEFDVDKWISDYFTRGQNWKHFIDFVVPNFVWGKTLWATKTEREKVHVVLSVCRGLQTPMLYDTKSKSFVYSFSLRGRCIASDMRRAMQSCVEETCF